MTENEWLNVWGVDPADGFDRTAFVTYNTEKIATSMMVIWKCPVCGGEGVGPHENHRCNVDGDVESTASQQAQEEFAKMVNETRTKLGETIKQRMDDGFRDQAYLRANGYRYLRSNECPKCGYELDSDYHIEYCEGNE